MFPSPCPLFEPLTDRLCFPVPLALGFILDATPLASRSVFSDLRPSTSSLSEISSESILGLFARFFGDRMGVSASESSERRLVTLPLLDGSAEKMTLGQFARFCGVSISDSSCSLHVGRRDNDALEVNGDPILIGSESGGI